MFLKIAIFLKISVKPRPNSLYKFAKSLDFSVLPSVSHHLSPYLFFLHTFDIYSVRVHLNVSSFSFYIFSVSLRSLLELTEEIFKGIVAVASAVSSVSAVSIASIAVIFIILTRLALSIILSLTVILAVSLILTL